MNFKIKIMLALTMALLAVGATARVIGTFQDWSRLEEMSSDIVIVYGGNPTPPNPSILIGNPPRSDSQVDILSVLKGTNNPNSSRLLTDHDLTKGQRYLVFGYYESDGYEAFENYRVIPLDTTFQLDSLKGKNFNEKLQVLLQSGVDCMNRKIQKDEEERDRLQQGIRK